MPPVYVYRCYDTDDRLLYIGATKHLWGRLREHAYVTWWAPQVVRVKATVHPSREAARHQERLAIRRERPRWNLLEQSSVHFRNHWTEQEYRDLVTLRRRGGTSDVSDVVYRQLQLVAREYQHRFGQVLEIGEPTRIGVPA